MKSKVLILIAVLIVAAVGVKFYSDSRVPESRLISEYLEGKEFPNETGTPSSVSATPAPAVEGASRSPQNILNESDQKKLAVLKEILAGKNDNDPRIDTDLKNLSPELKKELVAYYRAVPAEKFNERGTVVFLIARDLNSKDDVDFVKSVALEKPCLSMGDCSKAAPPASGEEAHLDGINETTTSLPQLHALMGLIEKYQAIMADLNGNRSLAEEILQAIREATHSPNSRVAEQARQALAELKH